MVFSNEKWGSHRRKVWDKMILSFKSIRHGTLLLVILSPFLKLLRSYIHCKKMGILLSLLPHFFQKKLPCWNTAGGRRSEVPCVNPLYSSMLWEMQGRSIKCFSSGQARTPALKITYSGVESAIKGGTNAQVKPHESSLSVLQGWQKDNCVKQARCLLNSGQPSS